MITHSVLSWHSARIAGLFLFLYILYQKEGGNTMFSITKSQLVNILTTVAIILIIVATVTLMLIFIPAHSQVTKIQNVTVPQAQLVKITSFDIDVNFHGNQDDFENILDNQELDNDEDIDISSVSFNEGDQDIDVPTSYFNPDSDDAVNDLLHKPFYIGQNYYANAQHPAVKVTTSNKNVFNHQLKNQTHQYNIWPKNLHVGQHVHDTDFTENTNKSVNNYDHTSYFDQTNTNQQNTIFHVEGHYQNGKYQHSWTGDYKITINNGKLTYEVQ